MGKLDLSVHSDSFAQAFILLQKSAPPPPLVVAGKSFVELKLEVNLHFFNLFYIIAVHWVQFPVFPIISTAHIGGAYKDSHPNPVPLIALDQESLAA